MATEVSAKRRARRKYRFSSREQAEAEYEALNSLHHVAHIVMGCLASDEAPDFDDREGGYRLRVFRLHDPTGGYAALTYYLDGQKPYTVTWYLDTLREDSRQRTYLGPEHVTIHALCEAANLVAWKAARAEGGGA